MQAVGVGGERQIGMVVHDEEGAVPVTQGLEPAGGVQNLTLVAGLVAELEYAGAAA